MSVLKRSEDHRDQWLLDDKPVHAGDRIEVLVLILGKWYTATLKNDDLLREYRLLVLNENMPVPADLQARFPEAPRAAGGKADQSASPGEGQPA